VGADQATSGDEQNTESSAFCLSDRRSPHPRAFVLFCRQQTTTGKSSGLVELVAKMYRDQGISGFYRGVEANVMRACVLNATKMGSYDMCKGFVVDYSAY
jgi:Mitochondrial carrier protein